MPTPESDIERGDKCLYVFFITLYILNVTFTIACDKMQICKGITLKKKTLKPGNNVLHLNHV